jgi:hypothetical protein
MKIKVFIKLRERKDTGNCKRKHWITLCGEPTWGKNYGT